MSYFGGGRLQQNLGGYNSFGNSYGGYVFGTDRGGDFCPSGYGYPTFCPSSGYDYTFTNCCYTFLWWGGGCCYFGISVLNIIIIILAILLCLALIGYCSCLICQDCPLARRRRTERRNRRRPARPNPPASLHPGVEYYNKEPFAPGNVRHI